MNHDTDILKQLSLELKQLNLKFLNDNIQADEYRYRKGFIEGRMAQIRISKSMTKRFK